MTAETRHDDRPPAAQPRLGNPTRALCATALIGCLLSAVGCTTGGAYKKPSWWAFGEIGRAHV